MGPAEDNDIRAEYDFTGGVVGKHCRAMQAGYTITIHLADGTTVVKDILPKTGAATHEQPVNYWCRWVSYCLLIDN